MKNKFEVDVADQLKSAGINPRYESETFEYYVKRKHTPDFPVFNRQLIIEAKGRFTSADRTKIKAILKQYPNIDYRIVFQNPNTRLNKTSQQTYATWCDSNGVKWCKNIIPQTWLDEIKSLNENYYNKLKVIKVIKG